MDQNKILLVDDERELSEMMARLLTTSGYRVKVAGGPGEALRILSEERFQLIITDLNMPGMNGTTLCRKIRQTDSESVIYALSSYMTDFDVERFEEIGFDGHLCKPTNSETLIEAIEGGLEKAARLRKRQDSA